MFHVGKYWAIRRLVRADVEAVQKLHVASFDVLAARQHSSAQLRAHADLVQSDDYVHELLSNNLAVALSDKDIIGTAGWCHYADAPKVARLRKIYVSPDAAGTGLGRRLVQHAEEGAATQGYTRYFVRANINAVGFYERLGYREEGEGTMPAVGTDLPVVFMNRAGGPAVSSGIWARR